MQRNHADALTFVVTLGDAPAMHSQQPRAIPTHMPTQHKHPRHPKAIEPLLHAHAR